MGQQLSIVVMIDTVAALAANTLEDHTYLFDNMKLHGSEGQGTGQLISAVNGSHWLNGSQASDQVLNWIPLGLGSQPPTLPRSFYTDQSKNRNAQALNALSNLLKTTGKLPAGEDITEKLKVIRNMTGITAKIKNKPSDEHQLKLMDVTGKLLIGESAEIQDNIAPQNPMITKISGEAVDKNIIYPAQYGSPSIPTDGWYWSASVNTSKPGIYAYTMEFLIYKSSLINNEWLLEPVYMNYQSHLKITSQAKINGFTHGSVGLLPIA